jgi:hypothetical protein
MAWGQLVGPEFPVNSYTTSNQHISSVASNGSGNFVVVWTTYAAQDGNDYGIFGKRFLPDGTPQGIEFPVNSYTTNRQRHPSVASDVNGNFVVVWDSYLQDGNSYGVFGRQFLQDGTPQGPGFPVNSYTTGFQGDASVASDANGNFVVVWLSAQDVFGQLFLPDGTPQGIEFPVNSYTTGFQGEPSVASDANGNFVVAWTAQDGSSYGIFGKRYLPDGTPQGIEFPVNSYTTGSQVNPSVASDVIGNFVVVWEDGSQDGSRSGIFGKRFLPDGTPQGIDFRVNTYTTNKQYGPSVASDDIGNFVVVWESNLQDGSDVGVFGQRYLPDGTPQGVEFRANSYTTSFQGTPSVASHANGNFVVAWSSYTQDGSGFGIFGQRIDMSTLPSLSINDVTVTEPFRRAVSAIFTVTLSAASTQTVSVSWASSAGTASAGLDYNNNLGGLIFSPGTTTRTVRVIVKDDKFTEPDETFFVNLSAPVNAVIADAHGQGTIIANTN